VVGLVFLLEIISQTSLAILTCLSILAFAIKRYKLGFVLGLCAQPFWMYSTYVGGLWGMFLVSIFITGSYVYGIINHINGRCKNEHYS